MKLENGITALVYNQGAGGNCNVLKEIVEPAGGRFDIRKVLSGDKSLSVLELWGAEFQENDGLLIQPSSLDDFTAICNRECAPFSEARAITLEARIKVSWVGAQRR